MIAALLSLGTINKNIRAQNGLKKVKKELRGRQGRSLMLFPIRAEKPFCPCRLSALNQNSRLMIKITKHISAGKPHPWISGRVYLVLSNRIKCLDVRSFAPSDLRPSCINYCLRPSGFDRSLKPLVRPCVQQSYLTLCLATVC